MSGVGGYRELLASVGDNGGEKTLCHQQMDSGDVYIRTFGPHFPFKAIVTL